MKTKLYAQLASSVMAYQNCTGDLAKVDWMREHRDRAEKIVKDFMPSGSGFDGGTTLDFIRSTPDKLVFITSFHHMNDGGYYDGWTEHTVTVRPSLWADIELKISGRNRNDIKDYIYDAFNHALTLDIDFDIATQRYQLAS